MLHGVGVGGGWVLMPFHGHIFKPHIVRGMAFANSKNDFLCRLEWFRWLVAIYFHSLLSLSFFDRSFCRAAHAFARINKYQRVTNGCAQSHFHILIDGLTTIAHRTSHIENKFSKIIHDLIRSSRALCARLTTDAHVMCDKRFFSSSSPSSPFSSQNLKMTYPPWVALEIESVKMELV